ncbi:MFS transporter ['Paenibacillus yunnanensis' Narsing Rao et al. 2020]|uniref:MFS transporter n=1 Tax=Paenibacillus tengchongensis TaxID=2608684 RepID=UPI00124E4D11|nr:MFS transporter [Paenibacillus tengchongensis]
MKASKEPLWTKNFTVVSVINFFVMLVFYLLIVIISAYAVDELHASTSQAGLATGIFIIGALIGRLVTGSIIDSFGKRKILFLGLFLFILTSLLYYIEAGIAFLLVTRLLHGIALGIASTATGTLIAAIIPASRKGEGIGYYSMSTTLATAIGPFLGLYLTQIASYTAIFTFCFALSIISFIGALAVRTNETEHSRSAGAEREPFSVSKLIEPKALPIAVVVLVTGFAYSSVLSYINFFAKEIGLVEAASFFFIVYAVSVLASRPFTGRLMDAKGENHIMYPAFIAYGLGLLLLSAAGTSTVLLLAGVLIGLGFGNMQSTTQAIAIKSTVPQRMGLATSTFFIFLDAGLGFGPYALGLIIPSTGYRTLYASLGVLILAMIIGYYFLHGNKSKARAAH